jgi:hypothetical protein
LRTGPLVYRGANVSRVVHGAVPAVSRGSSSPKLPSVQCSPFSALPRPHLEPIIEASCLHQRCRLPINLREFLSEQLGSTLNCDSDAILSLAAKADQDTLSKLARAIRRYSTARAHQNWAECSEALARFAHEGAIAHGTPKAGLCLRCACIAFGDSFADHRKCECLVVDLAPACLAQSAGLDANGEAGETRIADQLQRQIEEFRTLRAAFALSHYELDLFTRGRKVTFTWHPLS